MFLVVTAVDRHLALLFVENLARASNVLPYGLEALLQPWRDKIEEGAQFQRLLLVRCMDEVDWHRRRGVICQYRQE